MSDAYTSLHLYQSQPSPGHHHLLPRLLQQSSSWSPTMDSPPSDQTCYTTNNPCGQEICPLHLEYNARASPWIIGPQLSLFLLTAIHLHWPLNFTNLATHFLGLSLGLFTCFLFTWNTVPTTYHLTTSYFRSPFWTTAFERPSLTPPPNRN